MFNIERTALSRICLVGPLAALLSLAHASARTVPV